MLGRPLHWPLSAIFAGQCSLSKSRRMNGQSERDKRKETLRQLKAKEKETFDSSLPMERRIFQELFDHLDDNLGDECDHSLTITTEFLTRKGIENIDKVVEWLNHNGGYCDCEVLMNVEEKFE